MSYKYPPKQFCSKCGKEMEIVNRKIDGYTRKSGKPLYVVKMRCPNAKWYNLHNRFRMRLHYSDSGAIWTVETL
jgi:hypothetical protein